MHQPVASEHPEAGSSHQTLALLFGASIALLFFYFLRGNGSASPLSMLNNGRDEAGAAKLAAYAFITSGLLMFLMRMAPKLGFYGLLGCTLTLGGAILSWDLVPRLGDGLPFAGAPIALAVMIWLCFRSWRRGAAQTPLSPPARKLAWMVSLPTLTLSLWIVALKDVFF